MAERINMRFFRWLGGLMLGLVLSSFVIGTVQAAAPSPMSFRLTRQAPSAATDVELFFTVPSGINALSDHIAITLPPTLDRTGIVAPAGFALTYGPTTGYEHTTSVAGVGNGRWGIQTTPTGYTLLPPNDTLPGSIPAGNHMVLRIGTWAGGSPLHTPPAVGIYPVSVLISGVDYGTTYFLIRSTDDMMVRADVSDPAPVGGGGGGGGSGTAPGPGEGGGTGGGPLVYDGTPPVISDLRATSITTSAAHIQWSTDESADAYLEYGLTSSYGSGTRSRSERILNNDFLLDGLAPDTLYHVHVRARDAVGNTRWSDDLTFRTLVPPAIGPSISDLSVIYVDDHQAIVRWTTNIDTSGSLQLTSMTPSRVWTESGIGRNHSITVDGLSAATTYAFRVTSSATPPLGSVSADGAFRTSDDTTPPANVSDFRAVYVASPRAVALTWVNPPDPDLYKIIITRVASLPGESDVIVCTTPGTSCTDVPPTGRTTIVYRAVAIDVRGNASSGALASVLIPTTEPRTPPTTPDVPVIPPSPTPPIAPTIPVSPPVRPSPDSGGTVLPPILHPGGIGSGGTGSSDETGRGTSGGSSGTGSTASSEILGSGVTTTELGVTSSSTGAESTNEHTSTTVADSASTLELVPEFFLSERVPATPDHAGVRSAILGRALQVRLPIAGLSTSLAQGQIQTSDGAIYQLAYREALGGYVTDFLFHRQSGDQQFVQIQAVAADGRAWTGRYAFHVWPPAQVLDVSDRTRSTPVATATIDLVPITMAGTPTHLQADVAGRYAVVLPNGRYHLSVSKTGYRSFTRDITVDTGVFVQDVQLLRGLKPLSAIIDPKAPLRENIAAVGEEIALAAKVGLEVARQPEVQAATKNVVAPVVVVATVGTTATAVTGFNLFNYLYLLFTQPLLLIRRRKRESWGVVYNALSKQPIELAIVRLLKAGTNFALQTRITDAQGRFSFFVTPGKYTIQVQKPGYQFPTSYLKTERMDVDFVDLYHGEALMVEKPVSISPNIPLDPIVKEEAPKVILRKRRLRKLQSVLGVVGIIISLVALVIAPSWKMALFVVIQVATYGLFRRLAIPPAPKRWGIVYDTDGKNPLTKAVVRIFDKKFNKLLETQITGKDGTYGFFAAKGVYYLTAEKPGYERYLSTDIDLTKTKDTYIDYRFALKRGPAVAK